MSVQFTAEYVAGLLEQIATLEQRPQSFSMTTDSEPIDVPEWMSGRRFMPERRKIEIECVGPDGRTISIIATEPEITVTLR